MQQVTGASATAFLPGGIGLIEILTCEGRTSLPPAALALLRWKEEEAAALALIVGPAATPPRVTRVRVAPTEAEEAAAVSHGRHARRGRVWPAA